MTSALAASVALAALAALTLNWSYYAQHEEASALPPLTVRRPLRSLELLFSNRRWLAGFLTGIGGWALYVAALRLGPLSVVQATVAGGIGLLALFVERLGGVTLSRREWAGVAVSISGLVLLGVSLAGQGSSVRATPRIAEVAAWMTASALVAALAAGPVRRALAAGAGLGVGAGFLYAAGDVGTKAAVSSHVGLVLVPAILAAHGLAFVLLQLGFQRGGALATAGVATLFTNALPIVAGMVVFGDGVPGGALGAARVVSFAAVVVGAAILTRAQAPERAPGAAVAPAR